LFLIEQITLNVALRSFFISSVTSYVKIFPHQFVLNLHESASKPYCARLYKLQYKVQYILAVQYSDTKLERKIFCYERYLSTPAAAAVAAATVALSSNN
jgi:hypothetical protein